LYVPSMVDKTASSERLVPAYWATWPQFHPAESSKLLENVGSCTSPHGITSHNTLIFNTVSRNPLISKTEIVKKRQLLLKQSVITMQLSRTDKTSILTPKDTQRRDKSQK
jgi:hypothetical protein